MDATTSPANILIVGDSDVSLRALATILSQSGYKVRIARSGREGLASAQASPPDLIMLNLRMPELDGYAACAQLRADAATCDIPVFFLGASNSAEERVAAFRSGGVDFIARPFEMPEVLARVATHIKLHRMQQRLQEQNVRLSHESAENARLFGETRKRAERMELLNNISMAIIGQADLHEVLRGAADGLTRVLGVEQVGIALLDGNRQHLIVMAEHSAKGSPPAAGSEIPLAGNRSMEHILKTRAPLAVRDAQHDPLLDGVHKIMAQRSVQSILLVPMLVRGEVIGTVGCDATGAPREFTPQDIELAQTVANLVALRLEQARLIEAERQAHQQAERRAEDLTGLYAAARAAARSLEIDDMLRETLATTIASFRFEAGYIAMAEPAGAGPGAPRYLRLVAEQGLSPEASEWLSQGLAESLGADAYGREALAFVDLIGGDQQQYAPEKRTIIARLAAEGWRSYAAIPLIHQQRALGVMALLSRQRRLSSTYDIALLNSLGHQIATAIANARLFQETLVERGRLQALIEASRDGIILVGLDGRILVANAPALELLGLEGSREDWLGKPLMTALDHLYRVAPQAAELALSSTRRLHMGSEPATEGEFDIPPHYVHCATLPVEIGTVPVGRLVVLRDLTEQHAAQQLRDDMTRTMVHDLRNPLTGISVSLMVLANKATGPLNERQRRLVETARGSADQMARLVNAILDVSRLESGQMPIESREVDLRELVDQLLRAQSAIAAQKALDLKADIPADLPRAWADPDLLYRVLENLVGNAVKFTPSGRDVRVGAHAEDGPGSRLLVSVTDTGEGIPLKIRERLFQKFVAGDQDGRGSGLGLAFCRLVLEAHGQRLWVESTGEQGTTFCFSLATAAPPPP